MTPLLVTCWRLSLSLCRLFVVAVVFLSLLSGAGEMQISPVCISRSDFSFWTRTTSSTRTSSTANSLSGGCRRSRVYVCFSSFGGLVGWLVLSSLYISVSPSLSLSLSFSLLALHADISDRHKPHYDCYCLFSPGTLSRYMPSQAICSTWVRASPASSRRATKRGPEE